MTDNDPAGKMKPEDSSLFTIRIVTVRRISQIFFLALFFWFCITSTVGSNWWQLRGWPVNWLLELDPLTGLATLLSTGKIYRSLIWGVLTIVLTLLFGRFFCGWVCPFGAMHQFAGFLGKYGRSKSNLSAQNRYSRWQSLKYYILLFFVASLVACKLSGNRAPLVVSLLDPIPFVHRFTNLTLLPFADNALLHLSPISRYYEGAWIIGLSGIALLLVNLWIPRFYCRYICPLGALFGFLSSMSFWQIGKKSSPCRRCMKCQFHCEGACDPMEKIRLSECLLCMNCMDRCQYLGYQASSSKGITESIKNEKYLNKTKALHTSDTPGEYRAPDISRRGFVSAIVSGATVIPMMHLGAATGTNWNPSLVRPPGSLPENEFLARCIKCDQCVRACPTNVIQPTGITAGGLQGLWTPSLNFRIGSSGCQLHCVTCGNVCPTGAILPLELEQRMGSGKYSRAGAIRIGTAFVDRGRCLPWAMNRPCIVCQENCPVSPKAIRIIEEFAAVRTVKVKSAEAEADGRIVIYVDGGKMAAGQFGTGDYHIQLSGKRGYFQVISNSDGSITVSKKSAVQERAIYVGSVGSVGSPDSADSSSSAGSDEEEKPLRIDPGSSVIIKVKLQRPFINPESCIGCGVCEHECPVKGERAIRVTAENESRSRNHVLIG